MNDANSTTPRPPTPNDLGMRKLGERATKIFTMLVDGLGVGDAKKLDNAPGAFMAVTVDFLIGASTRRPWAVYAIAHRYLANGDLVPDPDVEFYVADDPGQPGAKAVYPIAIDHGPLGYHCYVDVDSAGQLTLSTARGQAGLARFCDVWMKNIAAQQRLEVR